VRKGFGFQKSVHRISIRLEAGQRKIYRENACKKLPKKMRDCSDDSAADIFCQTQRVATCLFPMIYKRRKNSLEKMTFGGSDAGKSADLPLARAIGPWAAKSGGDE
jgi:hypothetical protein